MAVEPQYEPQSCTLDKTPCSFSRVPGPGVRVQYNDASEMFEVWATNHDLLPMPFYMGAHDDPDNAREVGMWLIHHAIACEESAGECEGFVKSDSQPGGLEHRHIVKCDDPSHLHISVIVPITQYTSVPMPFHQRLPLTTHHHGRTN